MNREFLFRGKLSHLNEWVYGNLIINRELNPYIYPFEVFERDGHHLHIDSDNPFWVNKETVCQFSGMLDKNSNKIFEGDICILEGRKCVCSFIKGSFVFGDEFTLAYGYEVEVIGNIFDNAELLVS